MNLYYQNFHFMCINYIIFRLSSLELIQYMYNESIPINFNTYEGEIILSLDGQIGRKVTLYYSENDKNEIYYKSELSIIHLSFLRYNKNNWNEFCMINLENPIIQVNVVILLIIYSSDNDYEIIFSLIASLENSFDVVDKDSTIIVYLYKII